VLLGSFLYPFKTTEDLDPKGSPLPLELIDVCIVDSDEDLHGIELILKHLPQGFDGMFTISTLGKTRFYAVANDEEAVAWVNSLREAKQEAITRSMGHSKVPVPASWQYYDCLGNDLVKRKWRIKQKVEIMSDREIELSAMGEGGQMVQGYYG